MPLQPLDAEQFWEVEIHWTKPLAYQQLLDAGCKHDDSAQLYHILARSAVTAHKSLYIGHTYDQCISVRLAQPDHTNRYADFIRKHPRHAVWVSCGIITMTHGKRTRKRVQDIESL